MGKLILIAWLVGFFGDLTIQLANKWHITNFSGNNQIISEANESLEILKKIEAIEPELNRNERRQRSIETDFI